MSEGHHDDIALNYIIPMADYLHSSFGIPQKDAAALAWSGISDAAVVKWSLSTGLFSYDSAGNKMTKSEFQNISAAYAGNQVYSGDEKVKGKAICN